MPNRVEMVGIDELDRNIGRIIKNIKSKDLKVKVLRPAARPVWSLARQYAPYDPTRKKGTHLRDAILISDGASIYQDVLVVVRYKRPGAPHAHLLEFGTVRMAARPFMRPAASAAAPEVRQIIAEELIPFIQSSLS